MLSFSYGQSNLCIARRVSEDNLDTSVSQPGFREKSWSVLQPTNCVSRYQLFVACKHCVVAHSSEYDIRVLPRKNCQTVPCNGYSQLQIVKLPVCRKERQQVTCNTYRHTANNVATLTLNKKFCKHPGVTPPHYRPKCSNCNATTTTLFEINHALINFGWGSVKTHSNDAQFLTGWNALCFTLHSLKTIDCRLTSPHRKITAGSRVVLHTTRTS
jgi:hypothetical protein